MFYKDDKISVIIDGHHLHVASRALDFEIDFKLLRDEFSRRGKLMSMAYFCTVQEVDDYCPQRPRLDWLSYNGYRTNTKLMKEYVDASGKKRTKGSMCVEIAISALEGAGSSDHTILFLGDGDYCPLVGAMQRRNTRVTIISTLKSPVPMVSDDLRRQADSFIELNDIRELIGRPARRMNDEEPEVIQ